MVSGQGHEAATFRTMSAHNLDDEATFCLPVAILDASIASFNGCFLFPRRVRHSALEDGQ